MSILDRKAPDVKPFPGPMHGIWKLALGLSLVASALPAQDSAPRHLPFAIGERLEFVMRAPALGSIGKGTMWIEGPADIRGRSAWLLRFDFKAGFGPFGGSDRSSSWIDAERMTALRYEKKERRVLSGRDEMIELFPDERRWTSSSGDSGTSISNLPLDELSFIYFIRTLPLVQDAEYTFERHFDAARNPTVVKVVGRESVVTRVGTFSTLKIEMVVHDSRNYEDVGVIRFNFTDDERRIPVRIESVMPIVGAATLTLEAMTLPALTPPGGGRQVGHPPPTGRRGA